jgi:hypothetical protein
MGGVGFFYRLLEETVENDCGSPGAGQKNEPAKDENGFILVGFV